MSFDDAVRELVERCPGARGAAIMDFDGIPLAMAPHQADLEDLGAELASIVRNVDQAGRAFNHGPLQQLSVFAREAVVVVTTIAAGYFLLLVFDRTGMVGRGRYLSRLVGSRLTSEFS